jgi:hypothetical protein
MATNNSEENTSVLKNQATHLPNRWKPTPPHGMASQTHTMQSQEYKQLLVCTHGKPALHCEAIDIKLGYQEFKQLWYDSNYMQEFVTTFKLNIKATFAMGVKALSQATA